MPPDTILNVGIYKGQIVYLVIPSGMKVCGDVLGADFAKDEIILSVTVPASWVTEVSLDTAEKKADQRGTGGS